MLFSYQDGSHLNNSRVGKSEEEGGKFIRLLGFLKIKLPIQLSKLGITFINPRNDLSTSSVR